MSTCEHYWRVDGIGLDRCIHCGKWRHGSPNQDVT